MMMATDLEIQVATGMELGKGSGEDAGLTVSARKLQEILRALPEGTEAALEVQNNRLQVRSGKSRFNLQTLPAADFPAMADPGAAQAKVTLPQKALRRAAAARAVRHGAAGHTLLPQRAAAGAGCGAGEGGRNRRAPPGLRGSPAGAEPGKARSDTAAQGRGRTGPSCSLTARTASRSRSSQAWCGLALERSSSRPKSSMASFRTTHGSCPRTTKSVSPSNGWICCSHCSGLAILSNEKFRGVRWTVSAGQPAHLLHQQRAGGGAGGAGDRLWRRGAGYRFQHHLPPRRAEQR